jgi:hypothetical protein
MKKIAKTKINNTKHPPATKGQLSPSISWIVSRSTGSGDTCVGVGLGSGGAVGGTGVEDGIGVGAAVSVGI